MTQGERHLCEWQLGGGSDFFDKLLDLISRADSINLARLALGFKEEVEAYLKFSRVPGYWDAIEAAYRRNA